LQAQLLSNMSRQRCKGHINVLMCVAWAEEVAISSMQKATPNQNTCSHTTCKSSTIEPCTQNITFYING
jgi:hypothetical protein